VADKKHSVSEADTRKLCEDWLDVHRHFWLKMHVGGTRFGKIFVKFGQRGQADDLVIINGHALFVEYKAPNGDQSRWQIEFEQRAVRSGAKYVIVKRLEDLTSAVKEMQ
jgi:hypothetical protein